VGLFNMQLGHITKENARIEIRDYYTFKLSLSARNQGPIKLELIVQSKDIRDIKDDSIKKATRVA
jgi:hypothetical protein